MKSFKSFVTKMYLWLNLGFSGDSAVKNLLQCRRCKTSWRRAWQPTPVFLARESHLQRNQVGYSPWGCKESDMAQWLNNNDNMAKPGDLHLCSIGLSR